jgi:NADH-quinone oxidoreductase subunit M
MVNLSLVLMLIVWLPIAMAVLRAVAPWRGLRYLPLAISALVLGLAFCILPAAMQQTFVATLQLPWLPSWGLSYTLGVDGLSALLVLLTAIMGLAVLLLNSHRPYYSAAFLLLQGVLSGCFLATQALVFYIFFEFSILLLFFIIGIWGGARKQHASFKFFIYAFVGSMGLLFVFLYLQQLALQHNFVLSASWQIAAWQQLALAESQQKMIFTILFLAFGIKVPLWPLHTWLPDAHTEAPAEGSVILAAVALKLGVYGILRFLLPITPEACMYFAQGLLWVALVSMVYISLVALAQKDLKRMIAYASIVHMASVFLGIWSACLSPERMSWGLSGAILQLLAHGLVSAALFFSVGFLYRRSHSHLLADHAGLSSCMPSLARYFMLFALANMAFPGSCAFVAEGLILLGVSSVGLGYIIPVMGSLLLAAGYMLWMYRQVFWGSPAPGQVAYADLSRSERGVLLSLILLILAFGCYPRPLLNYLQPYLATLEQQIFKEKI